MSHFSSQVCEWKEPEELRRLLDLELRSQGESQEQILERCRAVIRYSVKTCGSRALGVGRTPELHIRPRSELPAPILQVTPTSSTSSSQGWTPMLWPVALSLRASTPASEPQALLPAPHKGFGFVGAVV